MLRKMTALLLMAACAAHAQSNSQTDNPETLAERSQATARTVLDRAVAAIGGADALRTIEVVRLQFEGETWPRLQMTTACAAVRSRHAAGNAAARPQEQSPAAGAARAPARASRIDNTIVIKSGAGHRTTIIARTRSRRFRPRSRVSSSSCSTTGDFRTCCCARRSIAPPRCARSGRIRSKASPMT